MDDAAEDAADNLSPGWDAITEAFDHLYPGREPRHFGPLIRYSLGGPDPLDGLSAWKRLEPVPHWHIVTYGLSELYAKESDDPDVSGYGFELTFRPTCDPAEEEPPVWALNFLQNLARYVFQTGNVFRDGDWIPINDPLSQESDTALRSIAFAADPELPALSTQSGAVAFLQVVGLTEDEERAAKQWKTARRLDAFRPKLPLLVTDLGRTSLLADPVMSQRVEDGTIRDGSSTGYLLTDILRWTGRKRLLREPEYHIVLGPRQVDEFTRLLPLRLPFDRPLLLVGEGGDGQSRVLFEPGERDAVVEADDKLVVRLTPATARALGETLKPHAGDYAVPGLPISFTIELAAIAA